METHPSGWQDRDFPVSVYDATSDEDWNRLVADARPLNANVIVMYKKIELEEDVGLLLGFSPREGESARIQFKSSGNQPARDVPRSEISTVGVYSGGDTEDEKRHAPAEIN